MTPTLPAPVAAYYAAKNRHDIDAMLAPFAPDATVLDEGETLRGHAAIRRWMEETTRKYRVTVAVAEVSEVDGRVLVAADVSGTFPGSPARLRFAFTLDGGRIARLEIG
ncbi:nuclear transport factor 2 family protein [Plastoroseomonas hellenica]|uniref:Nuclear transport factor 2 family protein n=1 Tax=Plastoroseomonas hellenica TaxID=2687306 RepID=A0ABS5EZG9_9PROT|nr:nuclear transport factor 2 family protein [Plastoroseomonas hellenica]MBR0643412.1 nuclear transport factor 2 family protein [Plastoroseomonas hellenica]MBR0665702.1 nuclear transport factor 2 family protein [Plastoroseomonas hellenica]